MTFKCLNLIFKYIISFKHKGADLVGEKNIEMQFFQKNCDCNLCLFVGLHNLAKI